MVISRTIGKRGVLVALYMMASISPASASFLSRWVSRCVNGVANYRNQWRQRRLAHAFANGDWYAEGVDHRDVALPQQGAQDASGEVEPHYEVIARVYEGATGKAISLMRSSFRSCTILSQEFGGKSTHYRFTRAHLKPLVCGHDSSWYQDRHRAGLCEAHLLQKSLSVLEQCGVHTVGAALAPVGTLGASKEHALYKGMGFEVGSCGYARRHLRDVFDENGSPINVQVTCKSCSYRDHCSLR